jgi:nucleobase:cation symporter-1, NCS1 family
MEKAVPQTGAIEAYGASAEGVGSALRPVPDYARTSSVSHQFWIWAGANIAPINWVLGALGTRLGLSLRDVIGVIVVGNGIGMAVFGFFVLMGQKTGVTQMVLGRSAFGRRGANVPAAIQGVMSAGWCAINTWIILDLCVALLGSLGLVVGTDGKVVIVLVVMALQTMLAARGFTWIATFEKYTVPPTLLVLAAMTIAAFTRLPVDWHHAGTAQPSIARWSVISTVMTAIGIGWGVAWFPYAADYSRFVPRNVGPARLYFASTLGQFVPVVWLGVLGAVLATISKTTDPGELIVNAYGVLAIPVLLLVLHGPVATNILNIYSCALCAQTLGWRAARSTIAIVVGLFATAFCLYLVYRGDFATSLDQWLASLVIWVAPWAAIMLVHYYGFRRGRIDVDLLFRDAGAGNPVPSMHWPAMLAFLLGMAASWACSYGAVSVMRGPIATTLGGIDLSWLGGPFVAAVSYYALESWAHRPPPAATGRDESHHPKKRRTGEMPRL